MVSESVFKDDLDIALVIAPIRRAICPTFEHHVGGF